MLYSPLVFDFFLRLYCLQTEPDYAWTVLAVTGYFSFSLSIPRNFFRLLSSAQRTSVSEFTKSIAICQTICYNKRTLFDEVVSMAQILPLAVGDVLEFKKEHPCGSRRFTVMRVGSDIRLICCGCGRDLTLPREKVEKATKKRYPAVEENSGTENGYGGMRES